MHLSLPLKIEFQIHFQRNSLQRKVWVVDELFIILI